jgi:hypothetical protein
MFPFAIPPVITTVLGVVGAVTLARALVKEWRRINAELDQVPAATVDAVERDRLPKLRRDPRTGVYRPE